MKAPAFAHAWSFEAAAIAPVELKLVFPPPEPKMKLRAYALLTYWSSTSSYSWMPGHLSRLPNWIGVSPPLFALARAASNAWNVVGTLMPSALSLALL